MSFTPHRERLAAMLPDNCIVVSYAGVPLHTNEDDYYNFEVNSQFFYLTGLEREGMILLMRKAGGTVSETLFIEEADPLEERWTGKMPTAEEVRAISGIEKVSYLPVFMSALNRAVSSAVIETAYFDTFRNDPADLPDLNLIKANEFRALYPAIRICDLRSLTMKLREIKDEEELAKIRSAVDITRQGLEFVMQELKPGRMEYQVQADFEYRVKTLGARRLAFNTIAGSGLNGCMMHYGTNHCEVKDGSLILLDLGAKYENYCSDITRTYPANGRFTERQRAYYELVLAANKAVRDAARPGVTLKDLNDVAKRVLGEGLVAMGKLENAGEVGKYYMHSVSHAMGVDCHDCELRTEVLEAGWVITDEPGLYIDEEEIGIRIEDDLLITEDGCEVLSADIIREADEIEAFMAAHRR